MDLPSNRSQDEDRVMQRQLYRAGQNQPAQASGSAASRPSSSAAAKNSASRRSSGSSGGNKGQGILTPSRRRKALIGLGVAAWLLLLGSISYCLSLPDLEAMNHERMAIFQDPNLTPEQRREKFEALREKEKNLTPTQRKQMREISRKEFTRKMNKSTFDFLKLSPEDQMAQLKKEAAEWEKRRKMWANKGGQKGGNRNGQNGGNKGGGQNGGRGGPGGPGGGGPGGWGGGGGEGNAASDFEGRQGSRSPEARAGGLYKMKMMQQMGVFGGGRGGPGGGRGGGR